jgi:hypothetical protein
MCFSLFIIYFNDGYRYGALSPISFISGIQIFRGPTFAPSATRGDFENYIARLYAVQKQVLL